MLRIEACVMDNLGTGTGDQVLRSDGTVNFIVQSSTTWRKWGLTPLVTFGTGTGDRVLRSDGTSNFIVQSSTAWRKWGLTPLFTSWRKWGLTPALQPCHPAALAH